ncbi:MAG: GNAT family N-acetyltransferase [Candidatus Baltobacteraceae bacterium]
MRLREISPDLYARKVLPLTADLWAGRRSFEEYVAQTLETARSSYGRRYYRTLGLYDGATMVASFKRYERTIYHQSRRLHAIGIGAVFTPSEYRGRGYASVMLGMALDRARSEGYELAYLFSDIRPQFYTELGFSALSSRGLTLAADALPSKRVEVSRLDAQGWKAIRHCFELCERRREAGFARTPTVWDWIRMRVRHGSEHAVGHETNLVVRRGRGVCAYVFGARAPERDAYIVDEYGFADDRAAELIPSLLRAAAGDLRRITGWLPPADAHLLLPRGTVRKRKRSILMMAPLRSDGDRLLDAIAQPSAGEFCWATDHI